MKTKLLITLFLLLTSFGSKAQFWFQQYFDGADTSAFNSIILHMDTAVSNVWQVGPPQKAIFHSASTAPNVLVTDTVNYYPPNNISRFTFKFETMFQWGVLALAWNQKLDLDNDSDGAIIEFSVDSGQTWQNVFNNPYVYNFYGFDVANADTLVTGEYAFSGRDTSWKNIWLCYDFSFLQQFDSILFRFTLKSDSIDNSREGWMIDNMIMMQTSLHTAKGIQDQAEYLRVYPAVTDGIVHIEAEKLLQFHIIESIDIYSLDGRLVQHYSHCPTRFFIDLRKQNNGLYFLKIKTNIKTETFTVVLNR